MLTKKSFDALIWLWVSFWSGLFFFVLASLFVGPAYAEIPAPVRTEVFQYGELVGGICVAVFQAVVGWWAIKKILLVSVTGAGRFRG